MTTIPEPTWAAGIRAIWTGPRCTAMSKQTRRRCKQAPVRGRSVCHWHGGRASAPLDNTNGVSSGRYMREDSIAAKANAAIGKSIRAMIRNAAVGYEKRLPAAAVHAQHVAFAQTIAACQQMEQEARQQKRARLEAYFERQEAKEAQRKADRRVRRRAARAAPART
jgi:hypothetical protein